VNAVARSNGEYAGTDLRTNLRRAFKASGCKDCGARFPAVDWSELHIHHLDPATKRFDTAGTQAYCWGRISVALMIEELTGCDVVCEACHRKRHREAVAGLDGQLPLFNGSGDWRYPRAEP